MSPYLMDRMLPRMRAWAMQVRGAWAPKVEMFHPTFADEVCESPTHNDDDDDDDLQLK